MIDVFRYFDGEVDIVSFWQVMSMVDILLYNLSFLEKNFSIVSDIEFCRECRTVISDNFSKRKWKEHTGLEKQKYSKVYNADIKF